jgi:hypothetical protein
MEKERDKKRKMKCVFHLVPEPSDLGGQKSSQVLDAFAVVEFLAFFSSKRLLFAYSLFFSSHPTCIV